MNEQEKRFVTSIKNKIKNYQIPIKFEDAINNYSGIFVDTNYNNGTTELVDARIERYLVEKSFYYFIKNYAYVEIPGIGMVSFEPYYFQEELSKVVTDYLKIVTEKSRQVGISTFFVLYVLWRANFHESENIDVVSLKQQKAQSFVSKMMPTLYNLPEFLKTEIVAKNTQYIKFQFPNGGTSMVLSEAQSENAGRSDSLSLLVIDEAAFMRSERMIEGIVASAQPTLSKTGGQMVIISTSNGIVGPGKWYYEQVQQAKYGDELNTLFVPIGWFEIPDDNRIKGPKKGYNNILEKYIQREYFKNPEVRDEMEKFFKPIGEKEWKNNDWLKKQHDDLQDTRYKQEVLRKFVVGGDKVFTEESLEALEKKTKEPIAKNEFGGTEYKGLWFWRYPQPKRKFIVTADPASGTSKDFSAIQIFDVESYEQVAEYKGHIQTKNFAHLIKKLAMYYNEAYVVVESNSIGEAVFNELYYGKDPYQYMYKTKKTKNGVIRFTGWETNTKTRQLIMNDLVDWLANEDLSQRLKVYSKRLWEEISLLVWETNNRIAAASGSHDDASIAMALALHLRGKAETGGESFMITEDGTMIESSKDKDSSEDDDGLFGIFFSDESEDDEMMREHRDWLLGK